MVTHFILFLSLLVFVLTSVITAHDQKILNLGKALKLDYPVLKTLVGQHTAQRLKKNSPLPQANKIKNLDILNQTLLNIHDRGEHLTVAYDLVRNGVLAGKDLLEIFEISKEKYPGILKWLLTVPLNKWTVPSDAHFFLAWIFNQADRGFDLVLWLERWFESDFPENMDAVYKADNVAFMEYAFDIPCENPLRRIFQYVRSYIIAYDAVNILRAHRSFDPARFHYTMGELVNAGDIKIIRYLKAKNALKSFKKKHVETIIERNLVSVLEVALDSGCILEVNDVLLAMRYNSYDFIRVMNEKKHEIVGKSLLEASMYNRGPISVGLIKNANIQFSQGDLNELGPYLPVDTINYIYYEQGIVPNSPMMTRSPIKVMKDEEILADELGYGEIARMLNHLNLNDKIVHHKAPTYIYQVIDSIVDGEKLMDGRLLNYHLCVAKNYGVKATKAYELLSNAALPKRKLSKYFSEALKDDLVGIYWVLQAAPLKDWASDKGMAHQFLITVFGHDYSYAKEIWNERCQEANFVVHKEQIYQIGNLEFLEAMEKLTCGGTFKPKMPVHSVEQFLKSLEKIAVNDAVGTVMFFMKKYPKVLEELKKKKNIDLLVEKRAIKILYHLKKSKIVIKLESGQIELALRDGHIALLEFALESSYVLTNNDIKFAIQQDSFECIKLMMDKRPAFVERTIKNIFILDPWWVPINIFKFLKINLTQEEVDKLALNVPTELVKRIFDEWGILPRINNMRKTGTIELELVKYLKTLPLDRNLNKEQAVSYFKDIKFGGYDDVTKVRLLDYYLFVIANQPEMGREYAHRLANEIEIVEDPAKIYIQVLEDQLAFASIYLQVIPLAKWTDLDEAVFFLAKTFGMEVYGIDIRSSIMALSREELFTFVIAIFAANNPLFFRLFDDLPELFRDLKKKFFSLQCDAIFTAVYDAVETIRLFDKDPIAIKYFEDELGTFIIYDAIDILCYLKEKNPSLKIQNNDVFSAIANNSPYALDFTLNIRKGLKEYEIEFAVAHKFLSCIQVMMNHEPKIVKRYIDQKEKEYPGVISKEVFEIVNPKGGFKKQKILPEKKKVVSLADTNTIKKLGATISANGEITELLILRAPSKYNRNKTKD